MYLKAILFKQRYF